MLEQPISSKLFKVRIIADENDDMVQELVNNWLQNNTENALIRDIQVAQGDKTCVMINYISTRG